MNNVPDATGPTSLVYDCNNLICTASECTVSQGQYTTRQSRHRSIEALRDLYKGTNRSQHV